MAFIKVDKEIKNWQWFAKENMLLVWIYLLTSAFYKDGFFEGMEIKKGQVPIGRKSLAEKLHISEQQIRTCINRLKSTGEITTQSTNKFTIITIVKWADYQSVPEHINQSNSQAFHHPATNEQPASNQCITTWKERKEQKEYFMNCNNKPQKTIEEMNCEELQDDMIKQERWVNEINLLDCFEVEFARPITQSERIRLAQWKEGYGHALVVYALRESLIQGKKSFDYINKILLNWQENGISAEDYEDGKGQI